MSANTLETLLQDIARGSSSRPTVVRVLQSLYELARSGELRDYPWVVSEDLSLYGVVFSILEQCLKFPVSEAVSLEESLAISVWIYASSYPEYDASVAGSGASLTLVPLVLDRLVKLTVPSGEPATGGVLSPASMIRGFQHLVLSLTACRPEQRSDFIAQLTKRLLSTQRGGRFAAQDAGNERVHVSALLQVLHGVIIGCSSAGRDSSVLSDIFQYILLPLYMPNEMVAWRDQIPILQTYHEDLVRCVMAIVDCLPERLPHIIRSILSAWPERFSTNTPKQVLLLHELELLAARCSAAQFLDFEDVFLRRFLNCIGVEAENVRPAQRALSFFKNAAIVNIFVEAQRASSHPIVPQLVEALYRRGAQSWNPTVNKMTALALKALRDQAPDLFAEACTKVIGTMGPPVARSNERPAAAAAAAPLPLSGGGMPPPSRGYPRDVSQSALPPESRLLRGGYSKDQPPPVTLTGVAPWAQPRPQPSTNINAAINTHAVKRFASDVNGGLPIPAAPLSRAIPHSIQEMKLKASTPASVPAPEPTVVDSEQIMMGYMRMCYPKVFEDGNDTDVSGNRAWDHAQASASPILLPDLKFHDIVYGRQLGEGAFSTVKYARQIMRDSAQSQWPEFAVKIMSSERLSELNYTPLALREIAALRLMVHPNICRLISHFRYKDSIYMVLEYAAKGDLHSMLVSRGKLEHNLLRFVVGEVVAALHAIHELGFTFNDLKPENVLITAMGHAKIADFGACRSMQGESRDLLFQSMDAVVQLRSGDWRQGREEDERCGVQMEKMLKEGSLAARVSGDTRWEGTAAYMPPEVFQRSVFVGSLQGHATAADSWAVGCVLYFCLRGKPLFFGALSEVQDQWTAYFDQAAAKSRAVRFEEASLSEPPTVETLQDHACEELIAQLLSADPLLRPSAADLLASPYLLTGLPANCSSDVTPRPPEYKPSELYLRNPPLWPEADGAQVEERWARRQFSSLWAPMPRDYNLSDAKFQAGQPSSNTEDPHLLTLLARPLPVVRAESSS